MEVFKASLLLNLPDELLVHITSYFDDGLDCLRLAYCCRRLYSIASPRVYAEITFDKLCSRSLSILVHTVLQNPRLARAVRSLTLMNEGSPWIDSRECHTQVAVMYHPAFINPIMDEACRSKKEWKKWKRDLKSGERDDPWLALMLPFLPNLEKFHLDIHGTPTHLYKMLDYRATRMSKLLGGISPFESLAEVSVMDLNPDEWPPNTLPLCKFPALQSFTGNQIIECSPNDYSYDESDDDDADGDSNEDGDTHEDSNANEGDHVDSGVCELDQELLEWSDHSSELDDSALRDEDLGPSNGEGYNNGSSHDEADEASGYSTVTHMHLLRSISDLAFKRHIRACAKLESFIYEYYNSGYCEQFNPATVYQYLQQHTGTLEELAMVQSNDNETIMDNDFSMPSLAGFPVLKRIWLRAANLLGPDLGSPPRLVDRLPPSLESLCVTDIHDVGQAVLIDELKRVVSAAEVRLPHLRKLTLEDHCANCDIAYSGVPEPSKPVSIHETQTLYGICKEAGIELSFTMEEFPGSKRKHSIV